MFTHVTSRSGLVSSHQSQRGSVLITALVFAIIIAVALGSYMQTTTGSLKLSHRTFFANAANNLAEAGTEEAVWSFNQLGNSTDATVVTNAWSGWNISQTVADVYMVSMGSGYSSLTPPAVTFNGGGGTGATGTPIFTTELDLNNVPITRISGVSITNPGTGYTSSPTVTISGGTGSGASAKARRAVTRTFAFPDLGQNASGSVKVWVAGYDGTEVLPIIVSKATITPIEGPKIEKIVKIILSKNGAVPKGLIAKNGINWNGGPIADSFVSSATPGVPPFTAYSSAVARSNITVGSQYGPLIDLGSNGVVYGNVMLGVKTNGAPVTVSGGTITGQTVGNLSYNFTMPVYPTNAGATVGISLGSSVPATLPRAADIAGGPAADGYFYYYTNGATIGSVTITAGKKVVIVGTATDMVGGLQIGVSGAQVGQAKIYMDGTMSPGNSSVNTASWPGALEVYTTTSGTCTLSGNGFFSGCLFAPNAELRGNGGGSNQQDMCGSFIVGSVTSNGHMCFHYDETLGGSTNPRAWGLALWKEMQSLSDRAMYASKLSF